MNRSKPSYPSLTDHHVYADEALVASPTDSEESAVRQLIESLNERGVTARLAAHQLQAIRASVRLCKFILTHLPLSKPNDLIRILQARLATCDACSANSATGETARLAQVYEDFFGGRVNAHANFLLFSGGSGSRQFLSGMKTLECQKTTVLINAYDDGKSTGAIRNFFHVLGTSDIGKNLTTLASQDGTPLAEFLEFRLKENRDEDRRGIEGVLCGILESSPKGPLATKFQSLSKEHQGIIRKYVYAFVRELRDRECKQGAFEPTDLALRNVIVLGAYLEHSNFTQAANQLLSEFDAPGRILLNSAENLHLVGVTKNGRLLETERAVSDDFLPEDIRETFLLTHPLSSEQRGVLQELNDPAEKIAFLSQHSVMAHASEEVKLAIRNADCLVISPGTLHSSILPTLATRGIAEEFNASDAPTILIANLQRERGMGSVADQVRKVTRYLECDDKCDTPLLDYVIVNTHGNRTKDKRGDSLVPIDVENLRDLGVEVVAVSIASDDSTQHEPIALARTVATLQAIDKAGYRLIGGELRPKSEIDPRALKRERLERLVRNPIPSEQRIEEVDRLSLRLLNQKRLRDVSPVKTRAAIFAAGKGTRLASAVPKVLFPIDGEPALAHMLRTLSGIDLEPLIIVNRQDEPQIQKWLDEQSKVQAQLHVIEEPLGTAHTFVHLAKRLRAEGVDKVLLSWGDVGNIREANLRRMLAVHEALKASMTVPTAWQTAPYAGLVRNEHGEVNDVFVTNNEGNKAQSASLPSDSRGPTSGEHDGGVFLMNRDDVAEAANKLIQKHGNQANLFGVVSELVGAGKKVVGLPVLDYRQAASFNTQSEAKAFAESRRKLRANPGIELADLSYLENLVSSTDVGPTLVHDLEWAGCCDNELERHKRQFNQYRRCRYDGLAINVDGTLIANGMVSREIVDDLVQLAKDGTPIAIVTGRTNESLFRDLLRPIVEHKGRSSKTLTRFFIYPENGAFGYRLDRGPKKAFYDKPLPSHFAETTIQHIRQYVLAHDDEYALTRYKIHIWPKNPKRQSTLLNRIRSLVARIGSPLDVYRGTAQQLGGAIVCTAKNVHKGYALSHFADTAKIDVNRIAKIEDLADRDSMGKSLLAGNGSFSVHCFDASSANQVAMPMVDASLQNDAATKHLLQNLRFTPFSVRQALLGFGHPDPQFIRTLEGGQSGNPEPVYFESTGQRLVLREHGTSRDSVRFVLSVMSRLVDAGIPAPVPQRLPTQSEISPADPTFDDHMIELAGTIYTVESHLDGRVSGTARNDEAAAQLAASVHNVLDNFQPEGSSFFFDGPRMVARAITELEEAVNQNADSEAAADTLSLLSSNFKFFREQAKIFQRRSPFPNLRLDIIHGDIKTNNLKFDAEGNVVGIVDFGFCQQAPRIVELDNLVLGVDSPDQQLPYSRDRLQMIACCYAANSIRKLTRTEARGIVEVLRCRFLHTMWQHFARRHSDFPLNVFEYPGMLETVRGRIATFRQFADEFSRSEAVEEFADVVEEASHCSPVTPTALSPILSSPERAIDLTWESISQADSRNASLGRLQSLAEVQQVTFCREDEAVTLVSDENVVKIHRADRHIDERLGLVDRFRVKSTKRPELFVKIYAKDARDELRSHSDVYVLAFSRPKQHSAAAALLKNGELLGAISESRLIRDKHCQPDLPLCSIDYLLRNHGVSWDRISHIALNFDFNYYQDTPHSESLFDRFNRSVKNKVSAAMKELFDLQRFRDLLSQAAKHFGSVRVPPVTFVRHHEAHAFSAWHTSPFSNLRTLNVVVDGRGEDETITMWYGDPETKSLTLLATTSYPHSLGTIYTAFTRFLGYRNGDQGKVMGLAPHGFPASEREQKRINSLTRLIEKCIRFDSSTGKLQVHRDLIYRDPKRKRGLCGPDLSPQFLERLARIIPCTLKHGGGRNLCPEEEGDRPYINLAYVVQRLVARHLSNLVQYQLAHHDIEFEALTVSGGVALNISANGQLVTEAVIPSNRIYIPPFPGDEGAVVGAGMCVSRKDYQQQTHHELKSAALGSRYSDVDIRGALDQMGLVESQDYVVAKDDDELVEIVSQIIVSHKTVAWFQGKSEFGPRALGQRSLLHCLTDPDGHNIINRIKDREPWRPVALSVTEKGAYKLFDNAPFSPFMTMSTHVKPSVRSTVKAGMHPHPKDGTTRPQIVFRESNELFWQLLTRIGEISDALPAVINTSFNRREPIVETPEEALNTFFYLRDVPILVMGRFIVHERPEAPSVISLGDDLKLGVLYKRALSSGSRASKSWRRLWQALEDCPSATVGHVFATHRIELRAGGMLRSIPLCKEFLVGDTASTIVPSLVTWIRQWCQATTVRVVTTSTSYSTRRFLQVLNEFNDDRELRFIDALESTGENPQHPAIIDERLADSLIARVERHGRWTFSKNKRSELRSLFQRADIATNATRTLESEQAGPSCKSLVLRESLLVFNAVPTQEDPGSAPVQVKLESDALAEMERARRKFARNKRELLCLTKDYWTRELPQFQLESRRFNHSSVPLIRASVLMVTLAGRFHCLMNRLSELATQDGDFELVLTIADPENLTVGQREQLFVEIETVPFPSTVVFSNAKGIARNRNMGVIHARGDVFLFLDDDDSINGPVVSTLIAALDEYPEFGLVTLPAYTTNGLLRKPGAFNLTHHYRNDLFVMNRWSGIIMATRAELSRTLPFNDAWPAFGEDEQFSRELHKLGFLCGCVHTPDSYVRADKTDGGATRSRDTFVNCLINEGLAYYLEPDESAEIFHQVALARINVYNDLTIKPERESLQSFWEDYRKAVVSFLIGDQTSLCDLRDGESDCDWRRELGARLAQVIEFLENAASRIREFKQGVYQRRSLCDVSVFLGPLSFRRAKVIPSPRSKRLRDFDKTSSCQRALRAVVKKLNMVIAAIDGKAQICEIKIQPSSYTQGLVIDGSDFDNLVVYVDGLSATQLESITPTFHQLLTATGMRLFDDFENPPLLIETTRSERQELRYGLHDLPLVTIYRNGKFCSRSAILLESNRVLPKLFEKHVARIKLFYFMRLIDEDRVRDLLTHRDDEFYARELREMIDNHDTLSPEAIQVVLDLDARFKQHDWTIKIAAADEKWTHDAFRELQSQRLIRFHEDRLIITWRTMGARWSRNVWNRWQFAIETINEQAGENTRMSTENIRMMARPVSKVAESELVASMRSRDPGVAEIAVWQSHDLVQLTEEVVQGYLYNLGARGIFLNGAVINAVMKRQDFPLDALLDFLKSRNGASHGTLFDSEHRQVIFAIQLLFEKARGSSSDRDFVVQRLMDMVVDGELARQISFPNRAIQEVLRQLGTLDVRSPTLRQRVLEFIQRSRNSDIERTRRIAESVSPKVCPTVDPRGGVYLTSDDRGNQVLTASAYSQVAYDNVFTHNVFDPANPVLAGFIRHRGVTAVVDDGIYESVHERIRKYFDYHGVDAYTVYRGGGSDRNKNMSAIDTTVRQAVADRRDRKAVFLAIGGGALMDVVGLAAQLYRRGTAYIRIPTTLLGIVDAGIGVKVGVNDGNRKNLLGAFHAPYAVISDPTFVKSQDRRQLRSGVGEMIKMAIVSEPQLFSDLEIHGEKLLASVDFADKDRMIRDAAMSELRHIHRDFYERDLRREVDFGHTFAHAIEGASGYSILHGEAVVIDIILVSRIAMKRGLLPDSQLARIVRLVKLLGFPTHSEHLTIDGLLAARAKAMLHKGGELIVVLPYEIGRVGFSSSVSPAELADALKFLGSI